MSSRHSGPDDLSSTRPLLSSPEKQLFPVIPGKGKLSSDLQTKASFLRVNDNIPCAFPYFLFFLFSTSGAEGLLPEDSPHDLLLQTRLIRLQTCESLTVLLTLMACS